MIAGLPASLSERAAYDINDAAALAYGELANGRFHRDYSFKEVHYRPVCLEVSYLMVRTLVARGHAAAHESAVTFSAEWPDEYGIHHTYCVLDREEESETVVDATWHQFLPLERRGDRRFPRVLVGKRPEFIRRAREAGITDTAVLALWLPLIERYEQPRLAELV